MIDLYNYEIHNMNVVDTQNLLHKLLYPLSAELYKNATDFPNMAVV